MSQMKLFGSKILKKCTKFSVVKEQHSNSSNTKETNNIFCISLVWLNNALFGKEIAVVL